MFIRFVIAIITVLCSACQSGLIPCAELKTIRLKKSMGHKPFFQPAESLSVDAKESNEYSHTRSYKSSDGHLIQNVSVEEWDCPRPGAKRYMPKAVKENIRKNMKKFKFGVSTQSHNQTLNVSDDIEK